ncbi:hypothetical protein G9A89_000575 [Geosiphon pyriformis]|nr:hypothetical protein G9A89_000575 [Geosiphon pyriformis]
MIPPLTSLTPLLAIPPLYHHVHYLLRPYIPYSNTILSITIPIPPAYPPLLCPAHHTPNTITLSRQQPLTSPPLPLYNPVHHTSTIPNTLYLSSIRTPSTLVPPVPLIPLQLTTTTYPITIPTYTNSITISIIPLYHYHLYYAITITIPMSPYPPSSQHLQQPIPLCSTMVPTTTYTPCLHTYPHCNYYQLPIATGPQEDSPSPDLSNTTPYNTSTLLVPPCPYQYHYCLYPIHHVPNTIPIPSLPSPIQLSPLLPFVSLPLYLYHNPCITTITTQQPYQYYLHYYYLCTITATSSNTITPYSTLVPVSPYPRPISSTNTLPSQPVPTTTCTIPLTPLSLLPSHTITISTIGPRPHYQYSTTISTSKYSATITIPNLYHY